MSNRIADRLLTLTRVCPAAGANANSDELDLKALNVGSVGDSLEMVLTVPATDTLVDTKDIDIELQHSDTSGSGFANVPGTGNFKVTGVSGNVSAKTVFRFYLPPDTKQYIRLNVAGEAGCGDVTDTTVSLEGRV